MQVLILAIQNAVPSRDMGVATSTSMMVRTLGGAVIVPVLGTIFNDRLRTLLPKLTPAAAHLDVTTLRASPETVRALAAGHPRRRRRDVRPSPCTPSSSCRCRSRW